MGDVQGLLAAFRDPGIAELIVNDDGSCYVEREGRLERLPDRAEPDDAAAFLSFLVGEGESVGPKRPYADLTAQDGSRVHVIGPPLTRGAGMAITIRKRPDKRPFLGELVRGGTMPVGCASFLKYCVEQKQNILVIGGTSSGKTTLLNALCGAILPEERILVLEDSPELTLPQPHVQYLRTRSRDASGGQAEVTLRELLMNTLRMRPDRIVVGEVRGPEAFDMLQAMNVGHEGSLCTMHANSPREALNRLETLVLSASSGEIPLKAVRSTIALAIDIVVFMARLADGSRRVCQVTEITGMEVDNITLSDIFTLDARQREPKLMATDTTPRFYDLLRRQGVEPPMDFFQPDDA